MTPPAIAKSAGESAYAAERGTRLSMTRFGANVVTADAWLEAVLVLELAANLHEKEEMLIYDFVADTTILASKGLEAFEGFFDVKFRQHDYDYGRSVAQTQLAKYQAQAGNVPLRESALDAETDQPNPDPALNNFDMSKAGSDRSGSRYTSRFATRPTRCSGELGVEAIIRDPLMLFYVRGQIKKLLAL